MDFSDNISLTLAYYPLLFAAGIILIVAYSVFIYKTTLPAIGRAQKIFLIFLRASALLLMLLLIFDPLLKITTEIKVEPKNLVFIDNSKSIEEFPDSGDADNIRLIAAEVYEKFGAGSDFYYFGNSLEKIKGGEFDSIQFDMSSTGFSSILDKIKEEENVASVIIISDGIINDGTNPVYDAEELGIPFYTIGIGDTSLNIDISVESIKSNRVIYADRETDIEILIRSKDVSSENITLQFFDNDELINSKIIKPSPSGINRIRIPYISEEEGLHELKVLVASSKKEKNFLNNSKSVLINVLKSKKQIAVIAGSPSRDLSAVLKSLSINDDFEINKIIETAPNKYYNDQNDFKSIEKADVIFLFNFPTESSHPELISKVFSALAAGDQGLFISLGYSTDIMKLRDLGDRLPMSIEGNRGAFSEASVTTGYSLSGLLGNSKNIQFAWEELPPINISNNKISPLGQSEVILKDKDANRPVMFSSNKNGSRNIAVLGINFWRWKLMAPRKEYQLFSNLMLNSAKWLALKEDEYFQVSPNKNEFKLGEQILFDASLYDKTFEPLDDQKITLKIFNDDFNKEYSLSASGNGLYETAINLNKPGIYKYSASVNDPTQSFEEVTGNFKVEPVEIELLENRMNEKLLINLASETGGVYYPIKRTNNLLDVLASNYQENINFNKTDNELRLSNFELILFIIVLLLSIEWIVRKYLRMI